MILSIMLSVVFTILGLIHINWVFGGKWGLEKALPTKESGEQVLKPQRLDSAVVGFGLFFFALFYIIKSGLIHFIVPNWIIVSGGWIIPTIFILRAVGDFKYVGFFKNIKKTTFGKADTLFFAPLCLAIGVIGVLIQLF